MLESVAEHVRRVCRICRKQICREQAAVVDRVFRERGVSLSCRRRETPCFVFHDLGRETASGDDSSRSSPLTD